LDDGFQHRALSRDLNILLLDSSEEQFVEKLKAGELLPKGRFREKPKAAFERADVILRVKRGWQSSEEEDSSELQEFLGSNSQKLEDCQLNFAGFSSVDLKTADLQPGAKISLVSTLARPEQFETLIGSLGLEIEKHLRFPDHSALECGASGGTKGAPKRTIGLKFF